MGSVPDSGDTDEVPTDIESGGYLVDPAELRPPMKPSPVGPSSTPESVPAPRPRRGPPAFASIRGRRMAPNRYAVGAATLSVFAVAAQLSGPAEAAWGVLAVAWLCLCAALLSSRRRGTRLRTVALVTVTAATVVVGVPAALSVPQRVADVAAAESARRWARIASLRADDSEPGAWSPRSVTDASESLPDGAQVVTGPSFDVPVDAGAAQLLAAGARVEFRSGSGAACVTLAGRSGSFAVDSGPCER